MKDFDSWNYNKKKIDTVSGRPPFFREGDIWHTSCGLNVGVEIDGKGERFLRPMLILKKNDSKSAICVPCTSNYKDRDYYMPLQIGATLSNIVISQIKIIDSKRFYKKFAEVNKSKLEEVVNRVCEYIKSRPAM